MLAAHAVRGPYVYIFPCSHGSYYVGSTWDVERQLAQHNAGDGAQYTRRRRPVELLWTQDCERVEDAFALEKQIQGWSRAKREALIEGRLADLPMLSKSRSTPKRPV